MFFFFGSLALAVLFVVLNNFLKWNRVKKLKLALVIIIVLNLIPFPREEHKYSSTFAEYNDPAAFGIGWPAAFMKFYSECGGESVTQDPESSYSINIEKYNQVIKDGKSYMNEDKCPSGDISSRVFSAFIFDLVLGVGIFYLIKCLFDKA